MKPTGQPVGAQWAGPGPYGGYPQPQSQGYPPAGYVAPTSSDYAASFFRACILCACLVILAAVILSLAGVFTMGEEVPEFRLMHLQLDNLSTSGGEFTGEWEARLKIRNPNRASMYLESYHVELFYKRDQIGQSLGTGLTLSAKEEKQLSSKASATPNNPIHVDPNSLEEIAKDRVGGTLTVSPRVGMLASYGDIRGRWTWRMEAKCDDVHLDFKTGNTGVSNINSDNPVKCKVK